MQNIRIKMAPRKVRNHKMLLHKFAAQNSECEERITFQDTFFITLKWKFGHFILCILSEKR